MKAWTVALAFVSCAFAAAGCDESPTGPTDPPPPPPPPPVVLANGNWTLSLVSPQNPVFCLYYFGGRTINFSQASGTGTLQGTTTTNVNFGVVVPTLVETTGTVDSDANVRLTITVTPQTATRPPACVAGSYFGPATITITNAVAAPAPPEVRQRVNGGVYQISAQGNSQTGSVAALTNP
jgi:hypothetical protein